MKEHDSTQERTARDLVVARPFTLTAQNGDKLSFGVGTHRDVPLEHADHWYAKLHEAREGDESSLEQSSATSEQDVTARRAAEDESQRLRAISQRAVDDCAAAQLECEQLRQKLAEVEAERDALRQQLENGDEGEVEEPSNDDVRVYRKNRRWFVEKAGEPAGDFPNKSAADAEATKLREAAAG